jgi:Protein-L-isoaspartate carboxylmethyltransferase
MIIIFFEFSVGDGRKGYLDEAPYDIIHVGGSIEDIPEGVSKVYIQLIF